MTESTHPRGDRPCQPPGSPWILLVSLAAALGLSALVLISPVAAEQLLLGWLYFPLRVVLVPQMTVDLPTLLLGTACLVPYLAILHATLRWLRGRAAGPIGNVATRWPLRGTLIVGTGLLGMFAAGTAMVGATHQSIWLFTGRAPRAIRSSDASRVFGVLSHLRSQARRSTWQKNLKQISIGMHNFHDTHRTLPLGGTMDEHGRLLHGWAIALGGFLDYTSIGVDFTIPWNRPPNDRLFRCALPMFLNPSIPEIFDGDGYGLSHVAGNVHVLPIVTVPAGASDIYDLLTGVRDENSLSEQRALRLDDIADGTSNTILFGGVVENLKPWAHPANVRDPALGINQSPDGFGCLPGESGPAFVMCDGAVRIINADVDSAVLRALGTPNGGEALSEERLLHSRADRRKSSFVGTDGGKGADAARSDSQARCACRDGSV